MERQNKMDRIVWVLRIAEETLKRILNPIAWEVYFSILLWKRPTLTLSLYFRFNLFVYFGSECALKRYHPPPPPANVTEWEHYSSSLSRGGDMQGTQNWESQFIPKLTMERLSIFAWSHAHSERRTWAIGVVKELVGLRTLKAFYFFRIYQLFLSSFPVPLAFRNILRYPIQKCNLLLNRSNTCDYVRVCARTHYSYVDECK